MHTNDNVTPLTGIDATAGNTGEPSGKRAWPAWAITALNNMRAAVKGIGRFIGANPTGAVFLAAMVVMIALTGVLVLSAAVRILEWLVKGHPIHDISTAVPVVHIVTDPIGAWLGAHLAGLPISTSAAAWAWGGLGIVLFTAAANHHLAARLLWLVFGATTAAMAWTGTADAAHRPIAVAAVAIAWSLLSLPALGNRPRTGTDQLTLEQACASVYLALQDTRRAEQATEARDQTSTHPMAGDLPGNRDDQIPHHHR